MSGVPWPLADCPKSVPQPHVAAVAANLKKPGLGTKDPYANTGNPINVKIKVNGKYETKIKS